MILVIALAIALSMDAFSLALCLGTLNFSYKKMLMISVAVGIFHFIMPIIGMYIAEIILKNWKMEMNIVQIYGRNLEI